MVQVAPEAVVLSRDSELSDLFGLKGRFFIFLPGEMDGNGRTWKVGSFGDGCQPKVTPPNVSGQIGCFVMMWLTGHMRAYAMSLHAEVWHALLADATSMWQSASEKVKDSLEML